MKPRDKKFLKVLGGRIKALREQQGISQDQLGYECGMHRVSVNRIEKGQNGPGVIALWHIAKALNVTIKELFDFPEELD